MNLDGDYRDDIDRYKAAIGILAADDPKHPGARPEYQAALQYIAELESAITPECYEPDWAGECRHEAFDRYMWLQEETDVVVEMLEDTDEVRDLMEQDPDGGVYHACYMLLQRRASDERDIHQVARWERAAERLKEAAGLISEAMVLIRDRGWDHADRLRDYLGNTQAGCLNIHGDLRDMAFKSWGRILLRGHQAMPAIALEMTRPKPGHGDTLY